MAYEHVNRTYRERLEDPEVFDSKKIFGVPSTMGNTSPQQTVETMEVRNSRWIQHIRMPDEPHIQGRVMESAIWLE